MMSGKKNHSGSSLLMVLGLLLMLAAMGLTAYNFWDMQRAADTANQVLDELISVIPETSLPVRKPEENTDAPEYVDTEEIPDYILAPNMDMPEQSVGGNAYIGTLDIPDLGLSLPVASGWSYKLLKLSPCRYAGSAYTDDLVIAAHNYRSHFGSLSKLSLDSEIRFTDMDGNVFCYRVTAFETLGATAVEEMTAGISDLTLFTCTVGGKSRIAVRADRIPDR